MRMLRIRYVINQPFSIEVVVDLKSLGEAPTRSLSAARQLGLSPKRKMVTKPPATSLRLFRTCSGRGRETRSRPPTRPFRGDSTRELDDLETQLAVGTDRARSVRVARGRALRSARRLGADEHAPDVLIVVPLDDEPGEPN